MEQQEKKAWFVRDGYMHWTPVTWQGWVVTLVPIAVIVGIVLLIARTYP